MTMSRRWLWVPALLASLRAAEAQETRFEIRVPPRLAPGEAAVIDETDLGSPVATLRGISCRASISCRPS
jgi:hypothetical protein